MSCVHVITRPPLELEPLIGAAGCERLGAVLIRRTMAVAQAFAGRRVVVDVLPEAGAERVFVVSADVPRLTVAHLACAAVDLDEGADASFGSTLDGGAYLLAMRAARADLLEHAPGGCADPAGTARTLAAAREAGLDIGLIRMERRLRGPADAAAMLADPLLPADVRSVLSGPDVNAPPA